MVLSFYVGQIQIILAWCITEFYLAMRGGREFQAGMWLGCLLLKPHYGLLLGLLLLWKRRWSAVLGAGAAGSIILGASVLVSGVHGLRAYPAAFSGMAQFRGDDPAVMINWRSVILDLYPSIYGRNGTLLTLRWRQPHCSLLPGCGEVNGTQCGGFPGEGSSHSARNAYREFP